MYTNTFVARLSLLVGQLATATPIGGLHAAAAVNRPIHHTHRQYDCSHINGGKPVCCQTTLAGDLPVIIALAKVFNVKLNSNDVNCVGGKSN
jgi:hypothetical protein